MIEKLTVILLAGSRAGADPICSARRNRFKSLVHIAGKPMIMHTLEGLSNSGKIAKIMVLTQDPGRFERELADFTISEKVSFCKSGADIIPSILEIQQRHHLEWPLLLTTADNCLLRDYHIDDFLGACATTDSDIAVGFLHKDRVLAEYPDAKRTWIRFSETELTGCNLYLFKSDQAMNALRFWEGFEARPKKFLRTAWALGPLFFWRYLTRRMSITETFNRLSRLARCDVQPVLLKHARIAIDADKLSDIRLIETILGYQNEDLLKANAGRQVAIFDLDRTITTFGTYTPFLLYYAYRNKPQRLLLTPVALATMIAYKLRFCSRKRLKEILFQLLIGTPDTHRLNKTCEAFVDKVYDKHVYPGALQEINRQRSLGAKLVLATASFDWLAGVFAKRLGFDTVVATRSIQHRGLTIPNINGENCYGQHKTLLVEEAIGPIDQLLESGADVRFFTDHHSDISLLQKCSHPVAVNPDARLSAWCAYTPCSQVIHWNKHKQTTVTHGLRPRTQFSLLSLCILSVTLLTAVSFTSSHPLWREYDIAIKDVPSTVIETVNSRYPGIVLSEASIEIKDDIRIYELEGEYLGRHYELEFSSLGELLEEELAELAGDDYHIPINLVPELIVDIVDDQFPGYVFLEASVELVDNNKEYEIELVYNQRKYEVEITADGIITEIEEEHYSFWQGLFLKFIT